MLILTTTQAFADTFEFLSFTAPSSGWTKESRNDGIVYRRANGIGLIYLYASNSATGSATDEFAKIWRSRVEPTISGASPQPQIQPEGEYNVAIGAKQVDAKGTITAFTLVTFVGKGRALGVLAVFAGDDVKDEITAFLESINTVKGTIAAPGASVEFTPPPGYIQERDGQMIVLKPSVVNEKTPCVYVIGAERASTGNIEVDAAKAILDPLPGWQLKSDRHDSFRGTAADGWPYFLIRTDVQSFSGGSMQNLSALSMAFPAGPGRVNIVGGFGSLSHCTGEEIAFTRLLQSLRSRGTVADGGKAFTQALTGTWQNSQAVGLSRYKFHPNGRFERGDATSTTFGNLETRTGTVGDGSWKLNGSQLTLTFDRRDRGAKIYRVRIFDKNVAGRWWRMMFLLDESSNPPLDVRYERIEN